MKTARINFLRANNVLIEENDDCTDTIIYVRTAKKGSWLAEAVGVGKNLKEACVEYVGSGTANIDKLMESFDRYLRFNHISTKGMTQRQYQNVYDKWVRTCLSGESMMHLICDGDTMVAIDWKNKMSNVVNYLGNSKDLF